MENTHTLRHNSTEASLPHQVEAPDSWGLKLPDPIPFTVTIPRWCPVGEDAMIELHWWTSLLVHLNALTTIIPVQEKAHYRVDKAIRRIESELRVAFGLNLSAVVIRAGQDARKPGLRDPMAEIGAWTMALQVAFGLLCTRTAAKGREDAVAEALVEIHGLVDSAMAERLDDKYVHRMLTALCTGTTDGKVETKLAQWKEALARAAEGAPEGVPGVAEALDPSTLFDASEAFEEARRVPVDAPDERMATRDRARVFAETPANKAYSELLAKVSMPDESTVPLGDIVDKLFRSIGNALSASDLEQTKDEILSRLDKVAETQPEIAEQCREVAMEIEGIWLNSVQNKSANHGNRADCLPSAGCDTRDAMNN